MFIKSIMIPKQKLNTLHVDDIIVDVLQVFDTNQFLSLPVIDGNEFVGMLSKGFIYETYFKNDTESREMFLQKRVKEFIKTKIPTVDQNVQSEDAATIFLNSNLRFIPVVNHKGHFVGIVTHKSLFKDYQSIYGLNCPKIVIYADNYVGMLAKIANVISKHNGNIKNIVQKDINLMGLQELTLRVECKNISKLVKDLINSGIPVRTYSEGDEIVHIDPLAGTQPIL